MYKLIIGALFANIHCWIYGDLIDVVTLFYMHIIFSPITPLLLPDNSPLIKEAMPYLYPPSNCLITLI